MKRKKFFLEVKVEGRNFKIPIDVEYKRFWVISRAGKELASVCCRKVYYRDALINHLSRYCQQVFDSGFKIDVYLKTFETANSIDERIKKRIVRNDIYESMPRWRFPVYKNENHEDCHCGSSNLLNIMLAIQDYFSQPENVKAISVAKTSTKFGL